MLNLFNDIKRSEKGDVVVEFAAAVPLLLLMFVGLTEVGRAFLQANAIEKGMRAAAVYAARIDNPTSAASVQVIENLVKTGTIDGSGDLLVSGWGNAAANLNIVKKSYDLNGDAVPVISLTATVPFEPVLPDLAGLVGLSDFNITLSHEQAYVDD